MLLKNLDYSIVICTYNPDERLLKRCLESVANLDRTGLSIEVILVDNNSLVPIESLTYVRQYLTKIPLLKVILAAKQGVKFARIEGAIEAKGKYIVYFDYDNEPVDNYLQDLKKLNEQFPQVGAIGPGNVTVEFIDGIDKKLESYARLAFQERHEEKIKFAGVREWQSCYPFGMGLCIQTSLMKKYAQLANQGKFTMAGRRGNELTSGEDTQMVLHCINENYFAGVSPTLSVKHIIHGARANYAYLKRLSYGTGLCYEGSLMQVFPEYAKKVRKEKISSSQFSGLTLQKFLTARLSFNEEKMFELIQFISLNAGVYMALNKRVPVLVKKIIQSLKLI